MKTNTITAVPKLRFPEFSEDKSWEVEPLIKCASFINKKIELSKLNLTNYISTENILSDFEGVTKASKLPKTGKATHFTKEDILISNIRPYLRKVWFSDFIGGASNDVLVVRAKNEVNSKYLSFYLMTDRFINYVMTGAKGVKMPRGDISQIKKYDITYSGTKEQQKIADCLSSLDESIEAEIQQLESLKTHKAGLLQNLFPVGEETVPNYRFAEFKDDGDWVEVSLNDLAKFRRGSFPQPYGLAKWYDDKNGMPFVQVYDVNDNLKLKSTTKRKISKLATEQSVFIPKGTLIITIQGSIGRVAITQYDAYIDRTLLIFQEFFKSVDKFFLAYVLQLLFYIEKQKAPGGIIKTITKEALSSFKIHLPDIAEQQKIANCLFSLDNLIQAKANQIDALKTHKQGLMQQLFPVMDEK